MTEKEVVEHFIQNWEAYFEKYKIDFIKPEYVITLNRQRIKSRVDIFACKNRSSDNFRIPVFIECKYAKTNSSRDLTFELQKLIRVRQHHLDRMDKQYSEVKICVLADSLDETVKSFMKTNDIFWFKYELKAPNETDDNLLFNLNYQKL